MNRKSFLLGCAVLLLARAAAATTFIVPTDDEMVSKSRAIVIGTVEGSYVQEVDNIIETVYAVRVERAIKGPSRASELISVVSAGGVMDEQLGLLVPGAAHFRHGDRVLLFLDLNKGRWATTDMTLGKFRFATSTKGDRVLVRDMEDVVGWDHAGRAHREKVRLEQGFLRFVEERVRGQKAEQSYIVEASEVTLAPDPVAENQQIAANQAPFPAATYTDWVNNQPIRWPTMSGGVPFWKRSSTNIAGAGDGGVAMIQNGIAAWNNECASLINLSYAGQRETASANHDGFNMVEYNDPQGRVGGSWGGSGTVAITFISFAGTHSFLGATWLNITGADVVFQDGYPATNPSFFSAMTHELGHGIGWRHSNQDYATGGGCNSSTQECTSQAIMNSSVSANYQSLQPWDVHAAESVYPGGTCGGQCVAPAVTSLNSATITAGQNATLSVGVSGTAPFTYQWYVGTSGNTSSPIAGATGSSVVVSPSSTTQYWVRVSNACGTVNSPTTTVIVNRPPGSRRVMGDYNGDGRADITVFRPSNTTWYSNGVFYPTSWGANGDKVVPADYDGDGRTDIAVWRPSNGTWYIRYMNGSLSQLTFGQNGDVPVPADYNGDGRTDIAVWRPSTGTWYSNGIFYPLQFGQNGDIPLPADYTGDGRADIVVWRPSTGTWYSNGVFGPTVFGQNGDVPLPADYDGNGRADIVIWRPSTGMWYSNGVFYPIRFGQNGDVPVPADYNGDGRADIVIWRPSSGTWYSNGVFSPIVFGQSGDIPAVRPQR